MTHTASGRDIVPGPVERIQMLAKGVFVGAFLLAMSVSALTVAQTNGSRGESLYDAKCAGCHGPAGRGGSAPSLVPFLWSDSQALKLVREPECDMPAIPASELSDEAVFEIFAYLKTIK